MTTDDHDAIDWQRWLRRWDAQQAGYVPEREERFGTMLDVLAALLPADFLALDLGCGPGSLSQRLLARFPRARCVALDVDPVMLALGRGALGTIDGRLRWVDADLSAPGWPAAGAAGFDAALSTTALHWLSAAEVGALYRDLAAIVQPGGVFLNGDHMAFGPELTTLRRMAEEALARDWSDASFAARGIETAEAWWDALRREPAAAPLIAERERRFAAKQRPVAASFDQHCEALRAAGFREVATVWQSGSDRVLLAVR